MAVVSILNCTDIHTLRSRYFPHHILKPCYCMEQKKTNNKTKQNSRYSYILLVSFKPLELHHNTKQKYM